MKKPQHLLKIFGYYLRDHLKAIILLALMMLAFFIVIALYALPTEAVLYAAAIAAVIGLLGLLINFYYYYRKHLLLMQVKATIDISLEQLPTPSSLAERDYQQLLNQLNRARQAFAIATDKSLNETVEYYTLWAHQIKTPLAAIRLLLQAQNQDTQQLKAELFKVEQYVEMVLAFMRLNSQDSDYLLQRYDLDPIIRESIRKYSRLFIIKGLTLDYQGIDLQVLTDEKWLAFVIEQLLANAIKYTEHGTVSIYQKNGHLVIADTGIGIPDSDLPRIFEQGFTGYNGRMDKKSTGLGLYLIRRILGRLNHRISIESTPGQGTKVSIGFPKESINPE